MRKLITILLILLTIEANSQIKIWGVNSSGAYVATDLTPIPGYQSVKRTADTTLLLTTLANVGGMGFPVVSGTYYTFKFRLIYSTSLTTTGVRLSLVYPAVTIQSAAVTIHGLGADGAASEWSGTINASGDVVVSTGVAVANANYLIVIDGVIRPSANGTLVLQAASEVASSGVILRAGSMGYIWSY